MVKLDCCNQCGHWHEKYGECPTAKRTVKQKINQLLEQLLSFAITRSDFENKVLAICEAYEDMKKEYGSWKNNDDAQEKGAPRKV